MSLHSSPILNIRVKPMLWSKSIGCVKGLPSKTATTILLDKREALQLLCKQVPRSHLTTS